MEKSGNTLNTKALIKKDMQFSVKRDSISILCISRKTTYPSVQNVERKLENMKILNRIKTIKDRREIENKACDIVNMTQNKRRDFGIIFRVNRMNKTERTLWRGYTLNTNLINRKYLLVRGVALVLAAGFALSAGYTLHNVQMQQEIASHIIRFHVRANSDSSADQALKLKVRDGIGTMMEERLEDAKNLEDSRHIIQDSLTDIVDRSEEILRENGCEDVVTASLTDAWFPVKTYGNSVFPKGTYEALQVTIGKGEGHNWWCVMYPNLCFTGSMYAIDETENEKKLRQVLTPEEYQTVMENKDYKVQFRILKFLNRD